MITFFSFDVELGKAVDPRPLVDVKGFLYENDLWKMNGRAITFNSCKEIIKSWNLPSEQLK